MRTQSTLVALLTFACVAGACSSSADRDRDSTAMSAGEAAPTAAESAASATPTTAPGAGASVRVATDAANGPYLTDGAGRALYMFEKDEHGESYCDSACAAAWPPYVSQGAPVAGDTAAKAAMLSTIHRKDGSMQVAYNGMPLYYYGKDNGPGSTKGQDVEEFGGEWYLVSPAGKKQEGKK